MTGSHALSGDYAGADGAHRAEGTDFGTRSWALEGNCRDADPESLFVQGAAQHSVKRICSGCPVRLECLADALDNRIEFGVWGGMTERERRALLRRRPDVRSWREQLRSSLRVSAGGRKRGADPA